MRGPGSPHRSRHIDPLTAPHSGREPHVEGAAVNIGSVPHAHPCTQRPAASCSMHSRAREKSISYATSDTSTPPTASTRCAAPHHHRHSVSPLFMLGKSASHPHHHARTPGPAAYTREREEYGSYDERYLATPRRLRRTASPRALRPSIYASMLPPSGRTR